MTSSFSRCLLVIVVTVAIGGCMSTSPTATPTPALTTAPLPTDTPITPTWTPVMLPPSETPAPPDKEQILVSIDVGGPPGAMALGNGYLWVIAGHSVVRIDPQTNQVVGKPIPVPVPEKVELPAIIVNQDALWVSVVGCCDSDRPSDIDSVIRIDPQTGEALASIRVARGPMSLALTPGLVWVVNFGLSADTVSRIDTKTNQLLDEQVTTGYAPYSMDVGDGSLWVINHDDGTLTRIDPETSQVIANIPLPAEPHRVAFGEGAVWVGNWHDSSVSRIDPQTNQVVGEPIPIGYHTGNIAAGGGNVWVTSDYRGMQAFPAPFAGHTVLVQIDPETDKVVDTISLGSYPVDVEVTEGAVWVSIQNPDRVLKIQP